LRFSRKRQDGSSPNFFSGFRGKHLFITTCSEKQCTRPLKAACMGPLPPRRTNLYWPCKAALTCPLLAHYGIVGWECAAKITFIFLHLTLHLHFV